MDDKISTNSDTIIKLFNLPPKKRRKEDIDMVVPLI